MSELANKLVYKCKDIVMKTGARLVFVNIITKVQIKCISEDRSIGLDYPLFFLK